MRPGHRPMFASAGHDNLAKAPSHAAPLGSDLCSRIYCTLWRRAQERPCKRDEAAKQQYLTPPEEQALVEYVLRMSDHGYPLPVKFLPSLSHTMARQMLGVSAPYFSMQGFSSRRGSVFMLPKQRYNSTRESHVIHSSLSKSRRHVNVASQPCRG